jgi:hypothetical protein
VRVARIREKYKAGDVFHFWPISDTHLGAADTDEDQLRRHVAEIQADLANIDAIRQKINAYVVAAFAAGIGKDAVALMAALAADVLLYLAAHRRPEPLHGLALDLPPPPQLLLQVLLDQGQVAVVLLDLLKHTYTYKIRVKEGVKKEPRVDVA